LKHTQDINRAQSTYHHPTNWLSSDFPADAFAPDARMRLFAECLQCTTYFTRPDVEILVKIQLQIFKAFPTPNQSVCINEHANAELIPPMGKSIPDTNLC
jgi:hypothetical protein